MFPKTCELFGDGKVVSLIDGGSKSSIIDEVMILSDLKNKVDLSDSVM